MFYRRFIYKYTSDVSKGWKDFDVKLPGTKQQETELTEEALQ